MGIDNIYIANYLNHYYILLYSFFENDDLPVIGRNNYKAVSINNLVIY